MLEIEHARMLEEPTDHRGHANVLRYALDTRLQRTEPAHDEIHLDPSLGRPVENTDRLRIDQRVHLGNQPRRTARLGIGDLALDVPMQGALQGERRLQHLLQLAGLPHRRELLEHLLHVPGDRRVAGE